MSSYRILIASGNTKQREINATRLRALGHEVLIADNQDQVMALSLKEQPDVVVLNTDCCNSGRKLPVLAPIAFLSVRDPHLDYSRSFQKRVGRYLSDSTEESSTDGSQNYKARMLIKKG